MAAAGRFKRFHGLWAALGGRLSGDSGPRLSPRARRIDRRDPLSLKSDNDRIAALGRGLA